MRILSPSRREDGAVAVMVAIFSVALLVVAAFTTDFGMAYVQRRALATGADSAALAVVRTEYKYQTAHPTRTCATIVSTDAASASAIAQSQVDANAPFQATTGTAVTTTLSCDATAKVLLVTVVVNRTVNRILGSLVGASSMQIGRQAVSALGVINRVSGLEPIGQCTRQAQAIIATHVVDSGSVPPQRDRAQLIRETKVWGGGAQCDGGGGSGNWGWLTFPGQGNGSNDLGDMIATAYSGTVTLAPGSPPSYTMDGVPGNRGNNAHTHSAMQTIMDKSVTLPVYDTVTGNGSNVTYKVTGFLSVQMCGYDVTIRGICYDPAVPMGADDMQVRYVDYIPAGELGKLCAIGDPCANDAYVYKLLN